MGTRIDHDACNRRRRRMIALATSLVLVAAAGTANAATVPIEPPAVCWDPPETIDLDVICVYYPGPPA